MARPRLSSKKPARAFTLVRIPAGVRSEASGQHPLPPSRGARHRHEVHLAVAVEPGHRCGGIGAHALKEHDVALRHVLGQPDKTGQAVETVAGWTENDPADG